MRSLLLFTLLFGVSVILTTVSWGCGGGGFGDGDGGEGGFDTGAAPMEAGDGSADTSSDHKEGGRVEGGDASDAPVEGGPEGGGTFTIGGTVTGLLGKGLVLQDNGGDSLTITKDGSFTFATPLASGATYAVTILTQPSSPAQTCTITGGSGTVATSNVTGMVVNCGAGTYTISGTVYGLSGTLILQNNGGDNLTLLASAAFVFPTPIADGGKYAVTVLTQPAFQTCIVTNGTGTVMGADVTNVSITCTNPTFTVGGNVSGLTGSGLALQDNGGDNLPLTTNGAFTFAKGLLGGSTYAVTIFTQPSGQYCSVTMGTGTVASADITTVSVSCAVATPYTIGGMVKGLPTPGSVVLQDNLADNLTVSANGSFTFATSVVQGHPYSVTVLTNPTGYYCAVSMGSGIVSTGNVTGVLITCYSGSAGGCGRFSTGYMGAWSTVSAAFPVGFLGGMGMSGYVPAGGTDTTYLSYNSSFTSYATGTDAYTALTDSPVSFPSYGSTAWFAGALWAVASSSVIRYDLTGGTWSTPATGVTSSGFGNQTSNDDAGNIWSYSSESSLLEYNISAGTTTYHTLPTPLGGSEPRIVFDSCDGLFYLTDYFTLPFYSYDPVTGTQKTLTPLPGSTEFQDGFCSDRSGHIFAVTSGSTMYQYTIATDTWVAMPSGGVVGSATSACGIGADGYLYATDPSVASTMFRIQLN